MCNYVQRQPAHVIKTMRHLMSDGEANATEVQIIWTISFKKSALKAI